MSVARTRFQRGETFTAGLRVEPDPAIDPATVECRMVMKRSRDGKPPGDSAPMAGVFDVSFVDRINPDDPSSPAAFIGVLSAEQTEALTPGLYAVDARMVAAGQVVQTDFVQVEVQERVTEPS